MEEQKAPPLEYTPMGDAFAEPPKKETTFTSDIRGIEKAADALEEIRAPLKRKRLSGNMSRSAVSMMGRICPLTGRLI